MRGERKLAQCEGGRRNRMRSLLRLFNLVACESKFPRTRNQLQKKWRACMSHIDQGFWVKSILGVLRRCVRDWGTHAQSDCNMIITHLITPTTITIHT